MDALKAAAALLIINSHLDRMYPRPWMSADGMLGNTIFFFTTGVALGGALQRRPDETLWTFLWKRLTRMYPAVWIVNIVVPPHPVGWSSAKSLFTTFIYPSPYTFLWTILPLYPIFYLVMRARLPVRALLFVCLGLSAAAVALGWLSLPPGAAGAPIAWSQLGTAAWDINFAAALLAGGTYAKLDRAGDPQGGGRLGATSALLIVTYLLLRFSATPAAPAALSGALGALRLFSLPAALALAICSLVAIDASKWAAAARGPIVIAISFLSAHTWETYVLHEGVARWGFVEHARFPLNIALVMAFTLALAPLLRRVTRRIEAAIG